MPKVGIISTFPPTQCGIATYANDLITSLSDIRNDWEFTRINLEPSNIGNTAQYFRNLIELIESLDFDILDIQHEFKIFGKPDGEYLEILLDHLKKPIITTLHTVSNNLNKFRERVFTKLVNRSNYLFVFSAEKKRYIVEKYQKQSETIAVIPHGIPIIEFKKVDQIDDRKSFLEPLIFISAGHMRSTKGYELAIQALNHIKKDIPNFKYLIVGSNHPENEGAQTYRKVLTNLISQLNIQEKVVLINEYAELNRLISYIQLSNLCLVPYTREDQSSSGILALMMACGRPVISTPFDFAKSIITPFSGIIAESFTHHNFANAIKTMIQNSPIWDEMSYNNYRTSKNWQWGKVAHHYLSNYEKILSTFPPPKVSISHSGR